MPLRLGVLARLGVFAPSASRLRQCVGVSARLGLSAPSASRLRQRPTNLIITLMGTSTGVQFK